MKHIKLERITATTADFDIDDTNALQQILEFMGSDNEWFTYKTNREVVNSLRQHGVKIYNYSSSSDHSSPNMIHIFTEYGEDLLD